MPALHAMPDGFHRPRQRREHLLPALGVRTRLIGDVPAAALLELELEPAAALDEAAEGVRVDNAYMVNVDQVLDEELPVALDIDDDLIGGAALVRPEPPEMFFVGGNEILERLRIIGKVDEDPAAPDAMLQRAQPRALEIDLGGLHAGCGDELAVDAVQPGMVGTAELGRVATAGGHLDAAMEALVHVDGDLVAA